MANYNEPDFSEMAKRWPSTYVWLVIESMSLRVESFTQEPFPLQARGNRGVNSKKINQRAQLSP